MDLFGFLAETIDSADPLLDSHWIPRKVIVDDDAGKLEINSFATDFGRQQDVDVPCVSEARNSLVLVRHPAVQQDRADAILLQSLIQIVQGGPKIGEHHHFFSVVLVEQGFHSTTQLLVLAIVLPQFVETSQFSCASNQFGAKRALQLVRILTGRVVVLRSNLFAKA